MNDEFEVHPGPLKMGDLIVIEVNGKIVPRRPDDPRPQWFLVNEDQNGSEDIKLTPITHRLVGEKVRKYRAGFKA